MFPSRDVNNVPPTETDEPTASYNTMGNIVRK